MASLLERFQSFSDKVSEKLNDLKQELGEISPWKGLSPNTGNSLTEDAEGKIFYKEPTAAEMKTALENLENTNFLSDADALNIDLLLQSENEYVLYTPQNPTPGQQQQAQTNTGVDGFQDPLTAYQNALN